MDRLQKALKAIGECETHIHSLIEEATAARQYADVARIAPLAAQLSAIGALAASSGASREPDSVGGLNGLKERVDNALQATVVYEPKASYVIHKQDDESTRAARQKRKAAAY